MAGCFGNSKEDRSRERQLNRYLDSLEEPLTLCEGSCDCRYNEDDLHTCTECGYVLCETCAEKWHTDTYVYKNRHGEDKSGVDYYCHDCYLKLNKENPEEYPLKEDE